MEHDSIHKPSTANVHHQECYKEYSIYFGPNVSKGGTMVPELTAECPKFNKMKEMGLARPHSSKTSR